ncbi:hypothetical protein HanPSC8_Chr12g0502081 [Helianthus annuus]|uniref:Uncharacterized protein n=1 Tax=Helianthus annuus TaxID=4232 RepID=A0A251SYN8_HELAN|nr:hypothetical protein HanPSC8_Chr12g0502081 [Helianthus annuus]
MPNRVNEFNSRKLFLGMIGIAIILDILLAKFVKNLADIKTSYYVGGGFVLLS